MARQVKMMLMSKMFMKWFWMDNGRAALAAG
jgi:hypothetical protein